MKKESFKDLRIRESFDVLSLSLNNSQNKDSLFLIFKEISQNYKTMDDCKIIFIELVIEISALAQIFFNKEKSLDDSIINKTKKEMEKFVSDKWPAFLYENYDVCFPKIHYGDKKTEDSFLKCFGFYLSMEEKKSFLKTKEVQESVVYFGRILKYFVK